MAIHPASINERKLLIDNTNCHIYENRNYNIVEIGRASSSINLGTRSMRGYEIFVRTFYGEINLPIMTEYGEPAYDITKATIAPLGGFRFMYAGSEFHNVPNFARYYVSDRGVVIGFGSDRRFMTILKHRIDKDGYHKVTIYDPSSNEAKIMAVHRLVYMAWVKSRITPNYVIHHKDSVVWHNYPSNLDCISNPDNIRFAANDGNLYVTALPFHMTETIVKNICEMMLNGDSPHQIAQRYGIDPVNDVYAYGRLSYYIRRFKHIKPYEPWADIVSQYDLSQYDYRGELVPIKAHLARAKEHNGHRQLPPEVVDKIRDDRSNGKSADWISQTYGIGLSTVTKYTRDYVNKNLASTTIERVSA